MDKIEVRTLGGEILTVRFPTDEEWKQRHKARKLVQRTSRGETRLEIEGGEEADLALVRAIAGETDKITDAAEASLLVERLAAAEVTGVAPSAEGFTVTLETSLGAQQFTLRKPSAVQLKRYRGCTQAVDCGFGRTELRVNLDIPAALFDELGGDPATPVIYKMPVVGAIVAEIQRLLEPSQRP